MRVGEEPHHVDFFGGGDFHTRQNTEPRPGHRLDGRNVVSSIVVADGNHRKSLQKCLFNNPPRRHLPVSARGERGMNMEVGEKRFHAFRPLSPN